MSDQRTPQGASLRADIEGVLAKLRAAEDAPSRLVLPDGAKAVFRVAAIHEHGAIGATVGYVHMTKRGVQIDAGITTAIAEGRHVRTVGQLVLTFR